MDDGRCQRGDRGAFDGGATEVVVADAHDGMLNLLWDALDPRAELIRGYENKPRRDDPGLDLGCDAVFCVGYHARAADGRGVLSHTFTGPEPCGTLSSTATG